MKTLHTGAMGEQKFSLYIRDHSSTGGSQLMRISLQQISLLRFFKKIYKFALCEFIVYALGYFISLVQFFG